LHSRHSGWDSAASAQTSGALWEALGQLSVCGWQIWVGNCGDACFPRDHTWGSQMALDTYVKTAEFPPFQQGLAWQNSSSTHFQALEVLMLILGLILVW